MTGPITLAQVAAKTGLLELACSRCERYSRLSVEKLIDDYGAGMGLAELQDKLAKGCPKLEGGRYADRCGAHFPQLSKNVLAKLEELAKSRAGGLILGTFLYFAYGSNMLTRRLAERTPSAVAVGAAFITGYRLTFDKVSTDGSGKCDIEAAGPDDRAWGVLFRIANSEEAALDDAEGLGYGYRKGQAQVHTVTPVSRQNAVAYFATQKSAALLPYHWYKAMVIAGAVEHGLPPDWIERLRDVASKQDMKDSRRKNREAILAGTS